MKPQIASYKIKDKPPKKWKRQEDAVKALRAAIRTAQNNMEIRDSLVIQNRMGKAASAADRYVMSVGSALGYIAGAYQVGMLDASTYHVLRGEMMPNILLLKRKPRSGLPPKWENDTDAIKDLAGAVLRCREARDRCNILLHHKGADLPGGVQLQARAGDAYFMNLGTVLGYVASAYQGGKISSAQYKELRKEGLETMLESLVGQV